MRALNPFRTRQSRAIGYVEHVADRIVRGWAWDAATPERHLCLDVFVRGIFAGGARTGGFRADLLDAGIGDGTHTFLFHIPHPLWADTITIDDVDVRVGGPRVARLGKVGRSAPPPAPAAETVSPHTFFAALVAEVTASDVSADARDASGRRQIDRLVLPSAENGVSRFVAHIAEKYGRPAPAGSDAGFWSWYLGNYALEKGDARALLSDVDLAAIRTLAGSKRLVFPPRPEDHPIDRDLWAVDGSRRLYVEDCLVGPDMRDDLRRVPLVGRWTPFPLSRFMILLRRRHALLGAQAIATRGGRIKLYALVMLFALRDAHYLGYLPPRWLRAMLDEAEGRSPFVAAQEALLGSGDTIAPRAFVAHARRLGFDVESQRFHDTAYRGHRVLGGPRVVDDGDPVDVQLIGPFRRSLGLAESCRRIAAALRHTDLRVNYVDFDVGSASARTPPPVPLGPIRAARLNILHLNAEEVPEAIASLPDCFSRSHTVIVPYWELNRLARVHALGLTLADEVWVATRYLAEVFAPSGLPVSHIGTSADDGAGISREDGRAVLARLGLPLDGFVFLTTFDALSWVQRKNVLGTIDAFRAAFGSTGPALIVKTRNTNAALSPAQRGAWTLIRSLCETEPRIVILDADLPAHEHRAIVAGCDCLVSLHRAEGLGLDLLDAMAAGTPVVATAYSGNMDFCDAETAWLVDYALVPVAANDYAFVEPGHVWANPKLTSAVEALRGVVQDAGRRAARAATGRERTRAWWSPDAFARRLAGEVWARLGPPPR